MEPGYITSTVIPPFEVGQRLELLAVASDRDIDAAEGKIVYYADPDLGHRSPVRVMDGYHQKEAFVIAGTVMSGYGFIPAGTPFYVVTHGGTLVARAD